MKNGASPEVRHVMVRDITGQTAQVVDRFNNHYEIRTDLLRAKGDGPAVGETWIIDRSLGFWSFAAVIGGGDELPVPDNFADAMVLEGGYGTVKVRNNPATEEPGEPEPASGHQSEPERSLWFKWMATWGTTEVTFDTFGSYYDPVPEWLDVTTGDWVSLDTVLEVFKPPPVIQGTSAQWNLDPGWTIGPPTGGTWTLTFRGHTTTPLPWNAGGGEILNALEALPSVGSLIDNVYYAGYMNFQSRLVFQFAPAPIDGFSVNVSGLTGPDDHYHFNLYEAQAGIAQIITPPAVDNLTLVTSSDDAPHTLNSTVSFAPENSAIYYIRVTGYGVDEAGVVFLNWHPTVVPSTPTPGTTHIHDGIGATSTIVGDNAVANNIGTVALGDNAIASGLASTAIGAGVSVGAAPQATGHSSVAIGASDDPSYAGARATSDATVAIGAGEAGGVGAVATGIGAVALGSSASATAGGVAIGYGAYCPGVGSVSISGSATATNSIAIGTSTAAAGTGSIAIGASGGTDAYGTNSVAIGAAAAATGDLAIGIGSSVYAGGLVAIQIGNGSSTGSGSIGIGHSSYATANRAIAIGNNAQGSASETVAIGGGASVGARAQAQGAIAIGACPQTVQYTRATYDCCVAIGSGDVNRGSHGAYATSYYATAIGYNTTASGQDSTALGSGATASHYASTAIGLSAATTATNQIMLGTAATTVVVPGTLVANIAGAVAVPPFTMSGPVATATSGRWYTPANFTPTTVRASLRVAGSTTTTVVLMKNGADVATVNLNAGFLTNTVAYAAAASAGDYFQVRTTAAGTGAIDLTVQVY